MSESTEKKLPVRNLERIGQMKYKTFEEADAARKRQSSDKNIAKLKIFARYDGTFDLVGYKKIVEKRELVKEVVEGVKALATERKHGLKSKDRKKDQRKK